MVLNSVYMTISSLNLGFSTADQLCRCVQFAMQQKLEQTCHLPWHGFKQKFLGWYHPVHRRGYMIVPPSNPPTQKQGSHTKRSIYSGRCPFTFAVKDFIDTVPRFVSYATCSGCDVRCKAVPYTVSLLRRKCGDYWLWEERDIQAAYILEI